ncbi:MAG: carboxypeptidase M32 [Chitinophagaceae bacterium]|nr:carboxypeptidase M32 [Chitinophagaceae bacterium]
MNNTAILYNQYKAASQKIADVKYANAVLQWDQETYLPSKGAAARATQMATLSELAHGLSTDKKLGELLLQLNTAEGLNETEKKNVQLSLEDYQKQEKFSGAFVRQMSEAVSASFHAWIEARKQNDFKVFQPALETLVKLKKEEAEILGYQNHPYNALLNEYEKGATVQLLDHVFASITKPLGKLLLKAKQLPVVDDSFLHQHFPKQQQWEWGMNLIKQLGFDFEAGRQDISEHPFTTNFSSKDVRLTTRIDENDFANMTWSCIHEAGHGLYEQGLPDDQYGLPCGEYASLSIHESQSRLWENCVGRSKAFWQHFYPVLQQNFPNQLKGIDGQRFYQAINKIQPTLIRTEADELTYHFHVQIRYNIEKEIIGGNCSVADIPSIWKEQYSKYLGVIVPNDKQGCLQDVHWSHGSFGYFPTYSLGSFYAAQFFGQAKKDIPNLEHQINVGSTEQLLLWLRNAVHKHGRMFTSEELCKKITGEGLNTQYFMDYISNKIETLY